MDLRVVVKYEDMSVYLDAMNRWMMIIGPYDGYPEAKFIGPRGGERISLKFANWLMGFPPGWTDIKNYKQSMKMIGNSVMPQHAIYALKTLMEI